MDRKALIKKWTPSPITAILLALIVYLWFRPPADVLDETRPLPPWGVTLTDGSGLTSEALHGRVVLVSFWATWCPYCRKEKPVLDAYWQKHRDAGFELVTISISDSQAELAAWMADKGYTHPAAALNASVTDAFGHVASVPTSFVLDRQGRIRHKVSGQMHAARLDELVAPLLAEPAAPPATPATVP